MQGVTFEKFDQGSLFLITEFSQALKQSLRRHLASICHGRARAETPRATYTYKNTIAEFLKRLRTKSRTTQLGMIGELLVHVLLLEHYSDFLCASPFFNMEERSIKKGFDLVLYDRTTRQLWITEVKSGRLRQNKDANATCQDLLHTAKRDLQLRLSDNNPVLWLNALNGAMICLEKPASFRKTVNSILQDYSDNATQGAETSSDKNALLAAGLFSQISKGSLTKATIHSAQRTILGEGLFRKVIAIGFQKSTCEAVVAFLEAEST